MTLFETIIKYCPVFLELSVRLHHSILRFASSPLGGACGVFLLLSGCAPQKVMQDIVVPPNPFGYQKVSSLCKVSPLVTAPDGSLSVEMTAGSDDGHCAVSVSKGGGGSYLSFGVTPSPEHGKAFLYNYNNRTYVNYTPVTAYKGSDQFGVTLIPEKGQPRRHLTVKVTVDAVSVAATPAVPSAPASEDAVKTDDKKTATVSAEKKQITHKKTSHSTRKSTHK